MGAAIQWKTVDTGAWRSEIVSSGRYRLASPATVTGAPSLAMQSASQNCIVRVYIGDVLYPDASLTVTGTTPVAILNAVGKPLTGQELFDLVIEVAMDYGENLLTTDEPNGTPSAPFASTAELLAAYPVAPGYSVRAYVGTTLENTEYVYKGPGVNLDSWWADIKTPTAYESLPALKAGSCAVCPRVLGSGVFKVVRTSTRWEVLIGEVVGRIDSEIPYTALVTAYTQIASVDLSNLVGDGEAWEQCRKVRAEEHVGGSDTLYGDINGVWLASNQNGIGPAISVAATGNESRNAGVFARKASLLRKGSNLGPYGSDVSTWPDATVDFGNFNLGVGVVASTVGNVLVLQELTVARKA